MHHSASAGFFKAPGQADERSARKTRGKQLHQRGRRGDGLECPAALVRGAPLEADSHCTDTHVKAISGLPVDYRRASGHAPVMDFLGLTTEMAEQRFFSVVEAL